MAGILEWFKPNIPGVEEGDKFTESFTAVTGYSCLIMVSILLVLAIGVMFTKSEVLLRSAYKKRIFTLYENLKTTKKSSLFFNVVFIYRRIVVCFVYLYLIDHPAQ
jgi:hypothetical protein